ncbi:hypothetical protein Enr17x_55230 [Gimesia fumaroli]|uniref:Uncharacterized protein n=1 Tax=Gimesia fumaroli TaxID=2527976 RepID=A0A518IK28_9PLAN|nr:hypothetical protein Enr17x_55230 [Gimesia fumaroli]
MHPCKTTFAVLPSIAIFTCEVFPLLKEKREHLKKLGAVSSFVSYTLNLKPYRNLFHHNHNVRFEL